MQGCQKQVGLKSPKVTRSALRRKLQRRSQRLERAESQVADLQQQVKQLQQQLDGCREQLALAQAQLLQQACCEQPTVSHPITSERPMARHQFTLTVMALSIELAKRVGFRPAADVLKMVFDTLGIDQRVPSYHAIEQWTLRLGVSSLQETFRKDQRVVWMADHSVQVGRERVLLIAGILLEDLPPAGETLDFEKLRVLAVVPGETWKKEDVAREYAKLAETIGAPVYLLCDGASELREAAETLEKEGQKTIVLGDLKHMAANVLKKEIGRSERFQSFVTQVGLTRSRVQQTELGHFCPRTQKTKSRFMNLGALVEWAAMVLHHLDHPDSEARDGIDNERMEAKFGWLREYADDVAQWGQCLAVIHRLLHVINRQGLDRTTARAVDAALREQDPAWRDRDTLASRIGRQLIEWIEQSAAKLHEGDRAWLSTEILESLFGRFKQLERQHSKGGFTRLIAALPTLCIHVTGDVIRQAFQRLDSPGLQRWLAEHLGTTLAARRNSAYREYRKKTGRPVFSLT